MHMSIFGINKLSFLELKEERVELCDAHIHFWD